MLATVRENLKGTLVIVVIFIFVVPMVISGVGTTFLGSAAGTDAAKVNGKTISNFDLDRAIRMRRNQAVSQQGVDPSSEFLTDENLRGPVLESLTRRMAIVSNGEKAGMSMSDSIFTQALSEQESFFTDGKFNQQKFSTLLAQSGLTPATFREEVKNDVILRHQALGLQLSAFSVPSQFEQLIKMTHQKRSFFAVTIPVADVENNIVVTADDIQSYYEVNQSEYEVPQKVKVDYLELSISEMAAEMDVSEAEIVQQYEAETANFSSESSYTVAHILLEEENTGKADVISSKLAEGVSFDELAAEFSDDFATKDDGGNLGVLTAGMFPEAFEQAVYTLEQGEVSEAVETEAGTHFIKVVQKATTEIPSLESRRETIAKEIAQARAADEFAGLADTLGELTYFSENLTEASEQLGLPIQQTSFFDQNSGSGIADAQKVRRAAFDEKVLSLGQNSNTIELEGDRVVVLRLAEQKAAYVKSLEEVLPLVEARVKQQRVAEKLESLAEEFVSSVGSTSEAETMATEKGYTFASHDAVKRTDFAVGQEFISMAFSAESSESGVSFESSLGRDGNQLIVGLTSVKDGTLADLSEEERQGFEAQIDREMASFSGGAYEASVVGSADISVN